MPDGQAARGTGESLAEWAWRLAFGALSAEEGFALREARATRHIRHGDPARYAGLLSLPVIEAFLLSDAARLPRVAMADGARQGSAAVPPEEFAREDGRILPAALFARFDAGATLVLSQFHLHHPVLARFCRGLERVFLHPVQSNIYLTPPGAQGFRRHFDGHDVLVLQVSGEKRWRIWEGQPFPDPTPRTPWDNRFAPVGEEREVLMRPGDALYVPRGVMHEAMAQPDGEPSLHITVGLLEPCVAALLRRLLDRLEQEEPRLRAAVPTWRATEPARLAEALAPALAALSGPQAAEHAALLVLGLLTDELPPLPARGLIAPTPRPGERWRLAGSEHHHAVPQPDGGSVLRWSGGVMTLSPAEWEMLARLEEGATAEELGEGGLAFLAALAAKGLIERA
ncbi:MAG: cupin domain-containing protein [Acetobacteraceae bacterium]|nr:cupin domain-containing protein [Acetobacteraceae bacterium]